MWRSPPILRIGSTSAASTRATERPNYWAKHGITSLLRWRETAAGQHIELGIAENNFYLALAMLGLAQELHGELLLPVGTVYDPFVARGLDALTYAAYGVRNLFLPGHHQGSA